MLKDDNLMKRILLILIIFLHANSFFGQIGKAKLVSSNNIKFADTLHSIVTDSFVHDLGTIPTRDTLLVKYFKYVGSDKDPVYITGTWTSDPFWISEYPKGALKKGEIYSITICFLFSNRGNGGFEKAMGFYLTNGEQTKFVFKGNIVKKEPNNIGQINAQNDSSLFYGAKSFMLHLLKTLEPQRNLRNEDSICRTFVPMDTLIDRLSKTGAHCISRLNSNSLSTNLPAFEDFIYKIDSSCTRKIEPNIFYFRMYIENKDPIKYGYQKPFGYGYLWFKILFDGNKYWLIPGHANGDVCLGFNWMNCTYESFSQDMFPWTPCWTEK